MRLHIQTFVAQRTGISAFTNRTIRWLNERFNQRHGQGSTIIASQLPVNCWHELIGETTYADAIMDRLIHCAQRFELGGDSMRKLQKN